MRLKMRLGASERAVKDCCYALALSFDVVPDWLPFGGLLDDALVLVAIFAMSRRDLDEYLAWASRK